MGLGVQIDEIKHDLCGGSTSLKVFKQPDGRVDGYCFRCGPAKGFVRHPYGEGEPVPEINVKKFKKTPEEIAEEMKEISTFKVVEVEERRLRQATLEKFGAKVSLSEYDGQTPTAIYWPITKESSLSGYIVKLINPPEGYSKAWNIGDTRDCDLIGWNIAKQSGANTLYITEGPEDMASIDRIFEIYGDEKYPIAVVSLPHGAGSARHYISKAAPDIKKLFKKVVLNFDPDKAGEDAIKEALLILPDAYSVTLPFKDANECLKEGASKAAHKQLVWGLYHPKNTNLVFAPSLHDLGRKPAEWGELTWPFPTLNDLTRGIRPAETIYIGAGVKMGKTELRDELAAHFIRNHDVKVMMASFEEPNVKTYKKMAGKLASKIFHDPKRDFDEDAYDEAGKLLANNLALLNVYQRADKEAVMVDIAAAAEWGAKAIFLDPITNFTNGVPAGEANTILQGLAQDWSSAARDYNITLFIFCHLKEPEGNLSRDSRTRLYGEGKYVGLGACPHERGGTVESAQFAGSRGMMR